ncbi:FAD-dependent oxidoreductase [Streptomyces sp. NPDC048643]|uniref:FAD-dependent oxidoreductase n=1 Tax=Streptomyces sp. NPDC048643 TaxID=3155637 RepID=UPI0034168ABB
MLQRWDDAATSRGGPVAYAPPGVLTGYGPALRRPRGGIHRAGTGTSTSWDGCVDGAVRSGERVAKGILAAL